jgi:hypothetical protein
MLGNAKLLFEVLESVTQALRQSHADEKQDHDDQKKDYCSTFYFRTAPGKQANSGPNSANPLI